MEETNQPKNKAHWKKGESGNPAGRKPGVPNHSTTKIKEAYIALIENNLDQMSEALQDIYKKDKGKFMEILMKLSPFVMPKQSTTDITTDGEPIRFIIPGKPETKKEEDDREPES